jgi:hypothetical protein
MGIDLLENFEVSIDRWTTEKDQDNGRNKGDRYTAFHISVSTRRKGWSVKRRYRQFLTLHKQLSQSLPHIVAMLPKLPAKKIFGSSLDPRFVEERRGALEGYLSVLTSIRESWASNELVSFLDDDESSFYLAMQIQFGRVVGHVSAAPRALSKFVRALAIARTTSSSATICHACL